MVAPDRLRFDFSHHEALTRAQLDEVERLANLEVLGDAPVRHYETTKEHAESLGAIAFFGDKYGDLVRVLEAGEHSIELCGGTHVHALGFIGPVKIVSEGSIGSNLRRIEALTGTGALARIAEAEAQLRGLADTLKVTPAELPDRVGRLLDQVKELERALAAERAKQAAGEASVLAAAAPDGVVVVRRDGMSPDDLRTLATATRDALGSGIAAVVGSARRRKAESCAVTKDLVGPVSRQPTSLRGAALVVTAKNPSCGGGGEGRRDRRRSAAQTAAARR
jgi:alanyl-tRNA synthetase